MAKGTPGKSGIFVFCGIASDEKICYTEAEKEKYKKAGFRCPQDRGESPA